MKYIVLYPSHFPNFSGQPVMSATQWTELQLACFRYLAGRMGGPAARVARLSQQNWAQDQLSRC